MSRWDESVEPQNWHVGGSLELLEAEREAERTLDWLSQLMPASDPLREPTRLIAKALSQRASAVLQYSSKIQALRIESAA